MHLSVVLKCGTKYLESILWFLLYQAHMVDYFSQIVLLA